jgi:hypothetical protein
LKALGASCNSEGYWCEYDDFSGKSLTLTPLDRNLKAFLKKAVPPQLWTALRKSWERLLGKPSSEPVHRFHEHDLSTNK